ncbi:DUF2535 family protein [Bacillus sp. HMF5848]|uniref:DUF2535 family protein n=1 Tax=Bacillus sp. HMF5848 TaxID=2495421 RepID=UPI000F76C54B|nr:DUF2535 family protein [Bacillus sp. HMF5848]RSK28415.1 DUF2535 family protein [Bacillus sp. HMF5848]
MYTTVTFQHKNGNSIIINEVPIYNEDNVKNYEISVYLQLLMDRIDADVYPNKQYSFIDFLDGLPYHTVTGS